jgi:long-chain fatty acid transport protein
MKRTLLATACAAIALVAAHGAAFAAGFQVREQSAVGLGRAFSGEAVAAEDASGVWYNPAQAARFPDTTVTGTISGIFADTTLENAGSFLSLPGGVQAPITGPAGDDPLDPAAVPAFAAVWPLNPRLNAAVSVNAPFGLTSDYNDGYFGRYDSTRSQLAVIDGSFTLAGLITPRTSVGASLHVQYIDAELENALPDPLGRGAAFDGLSRLQGDDISAGWSLGVTQQLTPQLLVAASYRSEIRHNLDGEVRVTGLSGPAAAGNSVRPAQAAVTLPDSARLAVAWRATDRLLLTAQAEWVGWSDFDVLEVQLAGGGTSATPFLYRDRVNYGVGADYDLTDRWTVRGGLSWDPTPTREGERSTRVPDGDRIWVATGATRRFDDNSKVDVGLAYVAVSEEQADTVRDFYTATPLATTARTVGDFEGEGLIVSVAYTRSFGG